MRNVRDRACGEAEDALTGPERGRRRRPAPRQSRAEKLLSRWHVIPHGDRRDGAESRGVEDEYESLRPRNDDVVRVLVLRDDVCHRARRLLNVKPSENRPEISQLAKREPESRQIALRNRRRGVYRDLARGHVALAQKSGSELGEPVVAARLRAREDPPYVGAKTRLAPVIPGRLLRARRVPLAGSLEERHCRRGIVGGVVAPGKDEVPLRTAPPGVLVDECA